MNLEGQTSSEYELSDERKRASWCIEIRRKNEIHLCFITADDNQSKKRKRQRCVLCLHVSVRIKATRRNKKTCNTNSEPSTCFIGQRAVNIYDTSQPGAGSKLRARTGSVLGSSSSSSSSHSGCKVSRETFWTSEREVCFLLTRVKFETLDSL